MAGLTLSAGVSAIVGLGTPSILGQTETDGRGETPRTSQAKAEVVGAKAKEEAKRTQPVKLVLRIAGLGAEGCEVEIKPANPACRFRPIKRHVGSSGELDDVLIEDMEVRGADRNCSFAITVHEPGQKSRTILRGFRLAARPAEPNASVPIQSFVCWLSSPSKLARIEESTSRK